VSSLRGVHAGVVTEDRRDTKHRWCEKSELIAVMMMMMMMMILVMIRVVVVENTIVGL
jgi:hypothetical protein